MTLEKAASAKAKTQGSVLIALLKHITKRYRCVNPWSDKTIWLIIIKFSSCDVASFPIPFIGKIKDTHVETCPRRNVVLAQKIYSRKAQCLENSGAAFHSGIDWIVRISRIIRGIFAKKTDHLT